MTNDNKTTARFLGEAEALKKRGISEATNNFYRIYRYGNTLRFPYYGADGTVVGFKIKTKSKDFH
jgi:twinkle protein